MTWRGRLARAWRAAVLIACGCATKASTLEALPPLPATPTTVTRSQKPENVRPDNNSVCLLSLPVARPAEASQASPTATIRAVVNGEPILEEEILLAAKMGGQLFTARTDKEREEALKQALNTLIEREVLLQDAISKLERGGPQGAKFLAKIREVAHEEFDKRYLRPMMKQRHISSREEFAELMRQAGISLEVMRRYWERNFMATEYLRSRMEPHITRIGHTEITGYYNSHRDEYTQPDSVDWQDIFIDAARHASRAAARQFAEALLRRAREGEDFAKLSEEFDNGTSGRYRKGDGEGHKRGEIRPVEAEPMLFGMHEGDMEIVERPTGFHVVRLVKRQYAGPVPFDAKVQKEIRDKLRMQVFLRERESIVKDLKRKAVIDISGKLD